ncbi:MAG: molybdopterin-guanine dinucleotide biosynthesis protein B [Eggerthellaceae bacterium]|nr:molybdopterin-guanine dinucleotide biosynthesis protein B [Eggerthellaceae bacterium]
MSASPEKLIQTNPASIAFIGRKNSGKTTLVTGVISNLTSKGYRIGSVKHHTHPGFEFDVPGKDSWRHAQAGSRHSVIVGVDRVGVVQDVETPPQLPDVISDMTDVDIVIVEGFRKTGIPSIEIIRDQSERDMTYLAEIQTIHTSGKNPFEQHIVALASNSNAAYELAKKYKLPCFHIDDYEHISQFIVKYAGLTHDLL